MKATAYIWKYRAANNNSFANYFFNPVFVDKIKVKDIPPDGIPIYNEQLEKSDETLEFTASDFDIKLSLLGGPLSVQGDSLREFLLPSGDRNFFYLCVVEFGEETDATAKRAGGKIDLNSIEADLTETRNKYEVRFKVTGLIKELSALQEKAQLTPLHQSLTIDMFISGCIKPDPAPLYLGFTSRLNWEERLGFEPILMWEVYNDIISRDIGKGKWSVFKELAKGFGFMFKLRVLDRANMFEADFPQFMIEIFWRSEGLNNVTVYRKSMIEKYSELNTYKNYFVITHRSDVLNNAGAYCGMLAVNDGSVYVADGLINPMLEVVQFEENSGAIITIENGQNPPVVAGQACTIIHLPTYETQYLFNTEGVTTSLLNSKFSFFALFCRNYALSTIPGHPPYVIIFGIKNIIDNSIGKEYLYFVNGIKKVKQCEIVTDASIKLSIYDTAYIDRIKFFCKSIRDINLLYESAITEWSEC